MTNILRRQLLTAVLALALATAATGQSPAELLRSFRKLEADTEAGVNFSEYARGMADVNAQLKSWSDANQGRPTPESVAALRAAFEEYQKARELWDESRYRDELYRDNKLSIANYFDRKRELQGLIREHWRAAGAETDRAAKLTTRK